MAVATEADDLLTVDHPPHPRQAWFDGELVDAHALRVSLIKGMQFGNGVYEGIRSYANVAGGAAVFRLEDHFARIRQRAAALALDIDISQVTQATLQVVRANALGNALISILLWAPSDSVGWTASRRTHVMVTASPVDTPLGPGWLNLQVTPRNHEVRTLRRAHPSDSTIGSVFFERQAAQQRGVRPLLVDNYDGVIGCGQADVFIVQDDRIVAVEHPGATAGLPRDTLIPLTGAEVRAVTLQELRQADEVFVCDTLSGVMTVDCLDNRRFPDNTTGREVVRLYQRVVTGRDLARRHWLTTV